MNGKNFNYDQRSNKKRRRIKMLRFHTRINRWDDLERQENENELWIKFRNTIKLMKFYRNLTVFHPTCQLHHSVQYWSDLALWNIFQFKWILTKPTVYFLMQNLKMLADGLNSSAQASCENKHLAKIIMAKNRCPLQIFDR